MGQKAEKKKKTKERNDSSANLLGDRNEKRLL